MHFDLAKPLVFTTDASEYGIGAVLSHTSSDGDEHHITCYSRTLSKAERNYSHLEKKGLAVIFGLKKQVPQIVSPLVQRWALMLVATYDYTIQYKPGTQIPLADALRRLPLADTVNDDNIPVPGETVMFL